MEDQQHKPTNFNLNLPLNIPIPGPESLTDNNQPNDNGTDPVHMAVSSNCSQSNEDINRSMGATPATVSPNHTNEEIIRSIGVASERAASNCVQNNEDINRSIGATTRVATDCVQANEDINSSIGSSTAGVASNCIQTNEDMNRSIGNASAPAASNCVQTTNEDINIINARSLSAATTLVASNSVRTNEDNNRIIEANFVPPRSSAAAEFQLMNNAAMTFVQPRHLSMMPCPSPQQIYNISANASGLINAIGDMNMKVSLNVNSGVNPGMNSPGNKKIYPCPHCEKKFEYKSILERHMPVHTGERNYICPVCKNGFKSQGSRDNHIKNKHTESGARESKRSNKHSINSIDLPSPSNIKVKTKLQYNHGLFDGTFIAMPCTGPENCKCFKL